MSTKDDRDAVNVARYKETKSLSITLTGGYEVVKYRGSMDIAPVFEYEKVMNTRTGVVHDSVKGSGKTRCGIVLERQVVTTEHKVDCQNCLHPGHGNLWPDEYDYTEW